MECLKCLSFSTYVWNYQRVDGYKISYIIKFLLKLQQITSGRSNEISLEF